MIFAALIALIYAAHVILTRLPHLADDTRRRWFIGISCTLLFAVCGFRDQTVGTDMASYLEKFTALREYPWRQLATQLYSERVEIGFALLNKAVGTVTAEPHAIMIVSAAIICGGAGRFVYRDCDDALTAIIVLTCCGWYLYAFNITRQMIAGVLLLAAWGSLIRRRYWHSAVWFGTAVLFHVTALVFVLAYLFYALRRYRTAVTVTIGVGGLLALLHPLLLGIVSTFTDAFSYLNNSREPVRAGGIWAIWGVELVLIAVYWVIYYFQDTAPLKRLTARLPHPLGEVSAVESLCCPLFCGLYIVFALLGTSFNNLDRFGVYFLPFCVPLFENFGNRIRQQSVRLYRVYRIGLQVCFVAFFLLFATRLPHYRYQFFWE